MDYPALITLLLLVLAAMKLGLDIGQRRRD